MGKSALIDANKDAVNQSLRGFVLEQAGRTGLSEQAILGLDPGLFGNAGALPRTRTRLSHAFTLRSGAGRVIGAVFRVSTTQRRPVRGVFDVNVRGHGEPVDQVSGNLESRQISVARFDLYTDIFEEVFGDQSEIVMLTDQSKGFRLREFWRAPTGFIGATQRQYEYRDCRFEDLGREISAEGDRTVRVNATISWLYRKKIQG